MPVSRVRQTRLQELSRKARWNTIRKRAAIITGTMTEKAMTVDIITEKDMSVDIIMEKDIIAGTRKVTKAVAVIMASKQS